MSLLQQVQRGKAHLPPRILVYGTEGVGKSSLAATTPKPIFIQTEDGLGEIDCDRFPLAKSLDDVVAALTELETQPHDYQTVAIDSLDWLERLVWDHVCRRESTATIEKVGGPSCVAKNRYRLKPEIPLAWDAIVGGILGSSNELSNPVSVPEGVTNLG